MTLTEVIKVLDGRFCNLEAHAKRMEDTARHFWGSSIDLGPLSEECIAPDLRSGVVKCRIVYSDRILSIDFAPYTYRKISTLALVEDNEIDYSYKFEDRSQFARLLERRGTADDILIVRNGFITDTSFTNVLFRSRDGGLYTPSTYLLAGTKRRLLLECGAIGERSITIDDLPQYCGIYLINAMIDIRDNITASCVPSTLVADIVQNKLL